VLKRKYVPKEITIADETRRINKFVNSVQGVIDNETEIRPNGTNDMIHVELYCDNISCEKLFRENATRDKLSKIPGFVDHHRPEGGVCVVIIDESYCDTTCKILNGYKICDKCIVQKLDKVVN
jgi:hypothetical protein